jgi:hypothetical protein
MDSRKHSTEVEDADTTRQKGSELDAKILLRGSLLSAILQPFLRLSDFEQSLHHQNSEIEISRPEIAMKNSPASRKCGQHFAEIGADAAGGTPEEFEAIVRS